MTAENRSRGGVWSPLRRAIVFGATAATILVAAAVGFLMGTRGAPFDWGFHAGLAIVLGVGATILLGVGLMALSFYSSRSGADASADRDREG